METFKYVPIEGYEKYFVSDKGRIFYYDKRNREVFLKQNITKGYCRVKLRGVDNKQHNYYVHRLVALTFIYNPDGKPFVDHIDCNPQNNTVKNLRWVTSLENSNNAKTLRHLKKAARTMKRNTVPVIRISEDGTKTKYPSIKSAIRDGYFAGSIYKCLRGEMLTHRGCRWIYPSSHSR